MFLLETYSIIDAIFYDENSYTTMPTLNKQIGSTSFCFEFDTVLTANNSQCWFRIGTDNNNTIYVGQSTLLNKEFVLIRMEAQLLMFMQIQGLCLMNLHILHSVIKME